MPDSFETFAAEPTTWSPGRVLVVDDDRAIRLLLRRLLESTGFIVAEADDGDAALETLESFRPEIILLDVVMPGLNGIETCVAIRHRDSGRNVPIVMVTGLDDPLTVRRAFDCGATSFITKPLNDVILPHRLRQLVRTARQTDHLRQNESRLCRTQRLARLGHWEWSAETDEIQCSDSCRSLLGLPRAPQLLRSADVLQHADRRDTRRARSIVASAIRNRTSCGFTLRIPGTGKTERVVHQEAEVLETRDGIRLIGTCQDVTERTRSEEQLRYLAFIDPLTRLPNRTLLKLLLDHAVSNAERRGKLMATLMVDLDQFNRINDSLGHAVGDAILREASRRLTGCLRCNSRPTSSDIPTHAMFDTLSADKDAVAHIGSDEFVVLITDISRPEDASAAAKRIADVLSAPFVIGDTELSITASIGISIYPLDGDTADTLLRNADSAMHQAKAGGRGQYVYFSAGLNVRVQRQFSIETGLRKALERDELVLHYQPQIDLVKRTVVGVEALVRWIHPQNGLIGPDQFIPVAEETGLIIPIGDWVMREACQQVVKWQDAGLPPLRMSVNLSASQFRQPRLAEHIWSILQSVGVDAAQFGIELTESQLIEDTTSTIAILNEMSALGVNVAVDDFGTGYSSLSHLKKILLSALKIDRSFVRDVSTDSDDAAIVNATIGLAHNLRLRVIAEGVENEAQLAFLCAKGCDEAQGYLFSRPLAGSDLTDWLHTWTWRPTTARTAR